MRTLTIPWSIIGRCGASTTLCVSCAGRACWCKAPATWALRRPHTKNCAAGVSSYIAPLRSHREACAVEVVAPCLCLCLPCQGPCLRRCRPPLVGLPARSSMPRPPPPRPCPSQHTPRNTDNVPTRASTGTSMCIHMYTRNDGSINAAAATKLTYKAQHQPHQP